MIDAGTFLQYPKNVFSHQHCNSNGSSDFLILLYSETSLPILSASGLRSTEVSSRSYISSWKLILYCSKFDEYLSVPDYLNSG